MIRQSLAIIERVRRIGPGWQVLSLAVEDAALTAVQPGQSFLVRTSDALEPYLRAAWVPVDYDAGHDVIEIERPDHENYQPGDDIHIIGPIGMPLPLKDSTRHVLAVAQDIIPTRLRFLLNVAVRSDRAVTLVLTGEAKKYPVAALPPAVEIIYSDDTQTWPTQNDTLQWADQVFVIAPVPAYEMYYSSLKRTATDARHALPEDYLFALYDLPTPCGTGACMACLINSSTYACINGPAVDLAKVRF